MALVGLVVPLLLTACGSAASPSGSPTVSTGSEPPPAAATQRSEGGQVTVVATWMGPAANVAIDVALDTHSIGLDALDLTDATLRNDRGETLTARPWAAPTGGHHREGALTFNGDPSSFLAGARWMELVLRGVGDTPERTLRWAIRS